jgi:CRISPR/Cas system-associated protein Csx1
MRLNKELDKIRDIMNIENEYKDYGFYVLKNEYKEEDKIDDRNLYAHCGFAYTIIQIKKVNEKIFIKIKDSVLDNIYKKISNNLLKGE